MLDELRGRTALITGASRGIGVTLARRLAKEGMNLVLSARDEAKLAGVKAECEALGARVVVVACDVQSADDRARLLERAGEVDALVNNAGIEVTVRATDQTEADVRGQIETNLVAPIELTRRVLPGMLARGRGAIAMISSMSGKSATPYNSIYAATKFGLNGFTSSLTIELEGTGVHAGVVCPSFISGAGMWASTGVRAPAMLREVTPEQVADGLVAVLRGSSEELVTPGPIRPLLAFRELAPSLASRIMKSMGILDVLEQRATVAGREREASGR